MIYDQEPIPQIILKLNLLAFVGLFFCSVWLKRFSEL